ncbi:MAG: ATP-binding cassette domain-containing protein [Methanobacteriaceae archaeon]|jgi:ABC-2 type transport system ATP-binding protein|nr:ATP-binding cassette domain-containing protein [Candidatus Methanorudis spinitermitis]
MKYAIETSALTKRFDDFLAVDTLDMKVKNKSIFGFLGPNGAGKTTTIKMLTCLIKPSSGTAKVGGYDINTDPNEVRQKIGMVPQLVSLYKDLTARENVELCADYYGIGEDEKEDRMNDLMELVDIKYAENKLIKQMSGGQKQKVSVVASLIHRPDVLFLDEPTIGLDPTTKMVLWDLIAELNDNGHTIVLCSHDMYEVDMLCENVGIIDLGKLIAFNTPQGLKDNLIKQKERDLLSQKHILGKIPKEFEKTIETSKLENSRDVHHTIAEQTDSTGNMGLGEDINLKSSEELSFIQEKSKELSIMINNLDEEMVEELKKLDIVYNVIVNDNGRLTVDVDKFVDDGLNNVIQSIVKNNGNITSINTKDPSLEDVFVDLTRKKIVDESNIKEIE